MTDEELSISDATLIARLRAGPEIVYRYVSVDHAAADRIEALLREKAAAYAQGYGDCEAETSLTEIGRTNEFLHGQIAKWKARNARLVEALKIETEAKLDAISTLDAWFDRRKLGHEAVDQAVVDAASGYLRTSRVGGMEQEESDMILGVIQDMARLGLFADLFARAALTQSQSDESCCAKKDRTNAE